MIDRDLQNGILMATFRADPDVMLTNGFASALGMVLDAAADSGVRAVILRSERTSFCAGAGPDHLTAWAGPDGGERIMQDDLAWDALFCRFEALPIPVIAEIDGAALGAGLGLALACDVRIMTPAAALGAPEVRFGLLPGGGTMRRILHRTTPSVARDLLMFGRILKGKAAVAAGLADACVPSEDLRNRTAAQAYLLEKLDPVAVAAAKRALARDGAGGDDLSRLVSHRATRDALLALADRASARRPEPGGQEPA